MAEIEILGLYEDTPTTGIGRASAAQSGDTYSLPRALSSTLTHTRGAVTTDIKLYDGTITWNEGSTAFTALKLDVTDTASAATSLLMDLQVGGTSKALVSKSGILAATTILPDGSFPVGIYRADPGILRFSRSNSGGASFAALNPIFDVAYNGTEFYVSVVDAGFYTWGSKDVKLYRDAANTLAQRNSTNAQTHRIYNDYASATDYQRFAITSASTTLASVTGASVTASSLIPAGAFLIGVTTRVDAALGETNGTTGYSVGDGVDADLWGDITGVAIGTASGSTDFTTATNATGLFTSAQDVVITATTGNFDGTGDIKVVAHYLITEAD